MDKNTMTTDDNFNVRNPETIGITLKNVVNEIAAGVSSSDFQQIVTILKNRSTTSKTLYEMQTADIISEICQSIDNMYSDTDIDAKYNEITNLANDPTTDKNSLAWRPTTGDCSMQLAAYRKRSLTEKKKMFQKQVEVQRSRRLLLQNALNRKRAHMESLLNHMEIAKIKLNKMALN